MSNESPARAYDEWHSQLPVDDGSSTPWHVLANQLLDERDLVGRTVLEIGCGRGGFAASLCRRGALVTASDIVGNLARLQNRDKQLLLLTSRSSVHGPFTAGFARDGEAAPPDLSDDVAAVVAVAKAGNVTLRVVSTSTRAHSTYWKCNSGRTLNWKFETGCVTTDFADDITYVRYDCNMPPCNVFRSQTVEGLMVVSSHTSRP